MFPIPTVFPEAANLPSHFPLQNHGKIGEIEDVRGYAADELSVSGMSGWSWAVLQSPCPQEWGFNPQRAEGAAAM